MGLLINEPTAIELGDLYLTSATPLDDVAWFVAGLVLLTAFTLLFLRWNHRPRPDPFV